MALAIEILAVQEVEPRVARGGIDAALTLLGPEDVCSDPNSRLRFPRIPGPHVHVPVSDIHCGSVWSAEDVASCVARGMIEPDARHVEAVLAFGRDWLARKPDARLIVHCAMGTSRSPAAALAIMALEDGPGAERRSADRLIDAAPWARPNPRLVALADAALGRGGALAAALAEAMEARPMEPDPDILAMFH